MTGIRDIERKIEALEDGEPADDLEIVIRERVVPTDWEPPEGEDDYADLAPGETVTEARRYHYDENGEWVCEDIE